MRVDLGCRGVGEKGSEYRDVLDQVVLHVFLIEQRMYITDFYLESF